MKIIAGLLFGLVALSPSVAYAHTGAGPAAGLLHGLAHPLTGADHLMAMIAVGLWAAQRGGAALWALPTTFVSAMVVGGAVGMTAVPLPGIEGMIVASVLVLGAAVALAARPPLALALAVVAASALVHGHAHGAEMPPATTGAAYAAGFALATTLLHATGVIGALALMRPGIAGEGTRGPLVHRAAWVRAGGAAIALCGLALLFV